MTSTGAITSPLCRVRRVFSRIRGEYWCRIKTGPIVTFPPISALAFRFIDSVLVCSLGPSLVCRVRQLLQNERQSIGSRSSFGSSFNSNTGSGKLVSQVYWSVFLESCSVVHYSVLCLNVFFSRVLLFYDFFPLQSRAPCSPAPRWKLVYR